MNFTMNSI